MRRSIAAAVLLCLFLSLSAFSQGGNSQLGGVITDPSNALMPGVTITVTNGATGVSNTAISNESGAYNFPSLQPGPQYKVTASLPGFQTKTITNLNIGVSVNVRQDFQMQIAATATNVEVTIEANDLLTTNSQSVGQVLTAAKVRDLPIVGNDVLSLLNTLPGVRGGQGAQGTTFAGVDATSVNTVRDGLSVSDGRFQSGVFSSTFINPDLVGELKVVLAPVDAEMGRGNGQVIISTRSGTNKYSGAVQWDVRNSALNPNTWANNRTVDASGAWKPTPPNWFNTHHYTMSFGGPIIKNKTFFYALWDQQLNFQRNIVSASAMTDVAKTGIFRYWAGWNPTNAEATTTFNTTTGATPSVDFGGVPVRPQYNNAATSANPTPYTGTGLTCFSVFGTVKYSGSAVSAADCPGGTMITPAAAWDPLRTTADSTGYISKILAKMPTANFFGAAPVGTTADGLNLALYRYTQRRRGNQGAAVTIGTDTNTERKQINLKIDQNFNSSHKLSVNYTREKNPTDSDVPTWPGGLSYVTIRTPQILTANVTSTLSSSLLNEGRFGIRYSDANIAAPFEDKYYPDKDVVTEAQKYTFNINGYLTIVAPGAGAFAFGGGANGIFNTNPGQYNGNKSKLLNYADTLSWTRGKHAFKFGGEWRGTDSNGYNNIGVGTVQLPYPRIIGGAGANASQLATASNTPLMPNTSLLSTARTNATNMLYFMAGSVNNASMFYWIAGQQDVTAGKWQDVKSLGRKFRDTIENEASIFYKDDWKVSKDLTLNLGVRWDWYQSPYLGSGFTSTAIDQGAGLFGIGRDGTADLFDNWLRPSSNIYLSGYGPSAGAAGVQCTLGTSNGANLPASSCDPSKMTQVEFIGKGTNQPKKTAYPSDLNNFGPAIGFSWNTNLLGADRSTTVRGGYQITYGGSGRLVGGGGATASETILGGTPGSASTANTTAADFNNKYLDLRDIPILVPVRPTSPVLPGGQLTVSDGTTNFSAVDPHYVTPYVQNFTLSVTTNLTRKVSADFRYIGTVSEKQPGSLNTNVNDVYFNKELMDALTLTRNGGDSPLLDKMLAGLNLNNGTTGYGPVGTCVTQAAGSTMAGLGKEGCAANAVLMHGSAALRRNSTFSTNLGNGNFTAVAASLLGNGSNLPTDGATGGLQSRPSVGGVVAIVNNRRLLRNGCDRIAAGLYNPGVAANNTTNIATQCFAENYMVANPQLGTTTYVTNSASSNYHSIQSQFTLRPTAGLSLQSTYTFSKNLGISGTATDPTNRRGDYTYTGNDRTHEFRTNGLFELPIGPNKLLLGNSSGWFARTIERWQTGLIFNWNSGPPASITTGSAAAFSNINSMYANGRPDMVTPFDRSSGTVTWDGPNNTSGNAHGGNYFGPNTQFVTIRDPQCALIATDSMGFNLNGNGNCTINAVAAANSDGTAGKMIFQMPQPGTRSNLGANSIRGLGVWSFDANISKTIRISESKSAQVRIDTTNVLNHPQPGNPNLDVFGGTFGQITTKTGGRAFQGTLRFTF